MPIEGVRYIYDENGNPKSVVLDLDKWGEIWEDIYDGKMAQEALKEGPMIPWETLKAEMDAEMEAEIERERRMYG